MPTKIFTIKNGDDMYDIFVNLWKLLTHFDWRDDERKAIFEDFRSRLPKMNMYWDALDLAKEFCKKIGYELVKEKN